VACPLTNKRLATSIPATIPGIQKPQTKRKVSTQRLK